MYFISFFHTDTCMRARVCVSECVTVCSFFFFLFVSRRHRNTYSYVESIHANGTSIWTYATMYNRCSCARTCVWGECEHFARWTFHLLINKFNLFGDAVIFIFWLIRLVFCLFNVYSFMYRVDYMHATWYGWVTGLNVI